MPFSLYKCMSRTFIGNVFKYDILQLVLILPLLHLPLLRQRQQRLKVQHQRLKLQHQQRKVQHQLPKVQHQRRRPLLPLIHLQLSLLVVLHLVPVISLARMLLGLAFILMTNARHSTGPVRTAMHTFW